MMSERTSQKEKKAPPLKTGAVVAHLKTMTNGWAGEGVKSKKPTARAVKQVGRVLAELENGRMPWPSINVLPNGGVALSWVSLCRDVMVTINPEGATHFVTSAKKLDESFGTIESAESEGFVVDMRTITHMMVWFCTDKAFQA